MVGSEYGLKLLDSRSDGVGAVLKVEAGAGRGHIENGRARAPVGLFDRERGIGGAIEVIQIAQLERPTQLIAELCRRWRYSLRLSAEWCLSW